MTSLVLDSEGSSRLARAGHAPGALHAALKAAAQTGSDVLVPAAVLAEQYRGGRHDQVTDACPGRFTGVQVMDINRALARTVGNLLARAGRGSEDHVDATVVTTAVAAGGGVIVTGDGSDITALADGLVGIGVEQL